MSTSAHTDAADRGALPLLLLPGTLCDARVFQPLLARMHGCAARVILTPDAHTMAEAAEMVLAQAPESFALLGFSLGGLVSLEVAMQASHRVCGLALISTTPRPVPIELHAERKALALRASTLPMCDFVEQQLWPGYVGETPCSSSLSSVQSMAEAIGPAAFARQTELALSRDDYRPRLGQIRCPTLLIAGDCDQLCPPAAQEELAMGIPHAQRLTLPGAGHLLLLERPDEIAPAVAAWLETTTHELECRRKDLPGPTRNKEHG